MYRPFQHKKDYEGDTDENNRNTGYSRSDNDGFIKKLGQRRRV